MGQAVKLHNCSCGLSGWCVADVGAGLERKTGEKKVPKDDDDDDDDGEEEEEEEVVVVVVVVVWEGCGRWIGR